MAEEIDLKWLLKRLDGHKSTIQILANAEVAMKARLSLGKIIEGHIKQFVETLPEEKRKAATGILLPKASDPFSYYDKLIEKTLRHDSAVVEKQILGLF
jgi:hypothetical protein